MPKIDKGAYYAPKGVSDIGIVYDIHYYKSDGGRFSMFVPDKFSDWYNNLKHDPELGNSSDGKIYGVTVEELKLRVKKTFDRYYDTEIKTEKVIAYNVLGLHLRKGVKFGSTGLLDADSLVGVSFQIIYRTTIGESVFYNVSGDYRPSSETENLVAGGPRTESRHEIERKYKIVEHTDELELWFRSLDDKLGNLAEFVHNQFGDAPSVLLENLNSGKLISKF
jgi:hypothetical protein